MSDTEGMAKFAFVIACIMGVVAVGYLMIFVILPVFLLAALIDFGMRQTYNKKFAEVSRAPDLVTGPTIHDFGARFVDGEVLIAWFCDLPRDSVLEIYRVEGPAGGSLSDLGDRAVCIHSTGVELTDNRDLAFVDHGVPPGNYSYIPVVEGLVIEKEPIPYGFFDFAKEVKFRQRKNRRRLRGEVVVVDVPDPLANQIPDARDPATKMADDVLAHFRERKKFDADLDAAIDRINSSSDLTDEEKLEAIELIETRAGTV